MRAFEREEEGVGDGNGASAARTRERREENLFPGRARETDASIPSGRAGTDECADAD